MYLKHLPKILRPLAQNLVFTIPNIDNEIYLTFDDGPHPDITPWVLEQLERYNAKATFFLVGANAKKYPHIVQNILQLGHNIGNHSYSHLSGWKTNEKVYLRDIRKCDELLSTNLFRPPYGQITCSQYKMLKKQYKIIMWSDLSADFDDKYSDRECSEFATSNVHSGSIIVFHDSQKAWPRLRISLPACLKYYDEKGFKLRSIISKQ